MTNDEIDQLVNELFEMYWELYDCPNKKKFSRGDLKRFFKAGLESGILRKDD